MAAGRQRRKRLQRASRRLTAPVRRISLPKRPVAVARSLVTPRIRILGLTERRSKRTEKKGLVPSAGRRPPRAALARRAPSKLRTKQPLSVHNLRARSAFSRATPCTQLPSPKRAGLARQAYARGEGTAPTERMYFHPWCGSKFHRMAVSKRGRR